MNPMAVNQFILDNLQEGDSCREMVMGDQPLFTQDHYCTIKQLIEETNTLTHIATRIYFKQSSIKYNKIEESNKENPTNKLSLSTHCDTTVLVPINREISPHLAACDVIEKIFNFVKPNLNFH